MVLEFFCSNVEYPGDDFYDIVCQRVSKEVFVRAQVDRFRCRFLPYIPDIPRRAICRVSPLDAMLLGHCQEPVRFMVEPLLATKSLTREGGFE